MLPSKVFGFMFLSDLLFIAYLWRYGPLPADGHRTVECHGGCLAQEDP